MDNVLNVDSLGYHDDSGMNDSEITSDLFQCISIIFIVLSMIFMLLYINLKLKQELDIQQMTKRNKVNVYLDVNENNECILKYKSKIMKLPEDMFDFIDILRTVEGKIVISMQGVSQASFGAYIYIRETVKKNFPKDKLIWTDYLHTSLNPEKKETINGK